MKKLKKTLQKWLEIDSTKQRISTLESLLLHEKSSWNGFAVLKKHLNRPDKALPRFMGKEIEQD